MVRCWECNGPHVYGNYPHVNDNKQTNVNNLHEASTLNDIARNIPQINVSLKDHQVDNQYTMLEVEVKISNTTISILIDSSASFKLYCSSNN